MLPPLATAQIASIRQQVLSGQPCWGDKETRIPVERYFSTQQWEAERDVLFRHYPLIVAHSSELKAGEVMAHDGYGIPLLLSRDADGTLRCFLNVCRHRGMRIVESHQPLARQSMVCPYHGWTYKLNGEFRHMLHPESFDPAAQGARDLAEFPCEERHGLIWVVPSTGGKLDLDAFLGELNDEMPFFELDRHVVYRTIQTEYAANWKLIVDAFLESYHIRVLHRETIYPFFTDCITATARVGPHITSLVARRKVLEPFENPQTQDELRNLTTPSQVLFPNTITIFHPDYLSLISLYPTGPETLRWTHRMVIPKEKATPEWAPHWEKTFNLIEKGVFQKEDIHTAVGIQKGLRTGANDYLTCGRIEEGLSWFHDAVQAAIGAPAPAQR